MKRKTTYSKLLILILGIASTIWFLIRVIPKPSRATYPCIKVAAPFMSTFVIYLLGIGASWFSFKKFRQAIHNSKYLAGSLFLFLSIIAFGFIFLHGQKDAIARVLSPTDNTFPAPANEPIGEAKGLFPGRVVWVQDTGASNENYIPIKGSDDLWYSDDNADEFVISQMLKYSLIEYASAKNITDAWEAIFKSFNLSMGRGEIGYTPGEKIAFKINLTNQSCSDRERPLRMDATPQLLNAILAQLVNVVGVAQADIIMGDPYREFREEYRNLVMSKYPDVYYVDGAGGNGVHQTVPSAEEVLVFSDGLYKSTLPQQYLDAAYVINIACLKSHNAGGITLLAKNHQGSYLKKGDDPKNQSAELMHYSLPWTNEGTGKYRHTVDYLGHDETGGKGLIYIVDGIWGGEDWQGWIKKFKSAPFNDDYPNSIFVGQDPVALESVCFDILFSEYVADPSKASFPIEFKVEVADHLSQCASSDYWPQGLQYDPEGDGSIMPSLGVFEHWNNPVDRQYSRNLGTGKGIELLYGNTEIIDYCDSADIVITPTATNETCPGSGNGNIEIEVTGSYPEFSYEWSNGETSSYIDKLSAGTYEVRVIDEKECTTLESITLIEPEKPILGEINGDTEVGTTETYTYSVPNQDPFTWSWMIEGGTISSGQGTNAVEIQWESGESGLVSVYAQTANGCLSDTSSLNISISVSGLEDLEIHGFSIYPIPVRNLLTIESEKLKHYSVTLSSINGAVLFNAKLEGTSRIDLSGYSNGVYLLCIQSGSFSATKKILKIVR